MQITKQGGVTPFESPDGKFVYYAKGRRLAGLWKVPADGGEEAQVFDHPKPRYWGYWAVVDDGIYFTDPDEKALNYLNFATRRVKTISRVENPPFPGMSPGIAVSPDGRWLLYTQQDQRGADLMLVENFRLE